LTLEPFRARLDARRELPPLPDGNCFLRHLTAHVVATTLSISPAEAALRLWPSDRGTLAMVMRAASTPAAISVAGWAAELARKQIVDTLEALGPAAAAATLLKQSLVLTFDRAGIISAPGFVAGTGNAGFVAEGLPIPVRQLAEIAPLLTPFKLATIGVLTREMIESSNAEALVGDVLIRSMGLALDAVLFSSNAATAAAPAGIRNGIVALPPSATTDAFEAVFEDVASLVNAVSTVGGPGPFVLIASAGRATMMRARFAREDAYLPIVASGEVGNDLICVAPAGLVAALDPEPVIETSTAATLHMNDAPAAIVNGGAPAAPARGLFQTDSIALKVRWPVDWALRDSRAVAWLTPAWK
jgi:hypothetical protein